MKSESHVPTELGHQDARDPGDGGWMVVTRKEKNLLQSWGVGGSVLRWGGAEIGGESWGRASRLQREKDRGKRRCYRSPSGKGN